MLQPQDHTVVSGEIATLDQSLSQLEAVESKLSRELNVIRARIDDLRNQRAALESRIAVVWCLPNEILAYIFELGAKIEKEERAAIVEDEYDDEDVDRPPFNILISHVCRAFRAVAIQAPTLWSQFRIIYLDPPRLDYVKACLQRSGCSRLDIMIDCDDTHLESYPDPIRNTMEILSPHIYRTKRFAVRLCGFGSLHHVMRYLNMPAPQLETLELSDIDYETGFDEDELFDPPDLREPSILFGGIMPKLEKVALDGVHVAWAECNFKGLTSLRLGYHTLDVRPTYGEFKAVIDASPALSTLSLRGSAPLIPDDTAESSHYSPLRMERLEDLHISDLPSHSATSLISLLDTPNLMSLSLTDLDTNEYTTFFHRITGPPALFPALTSLKLASIEAKDSAIENLLRASSNLTYLGLYLRGMPASISWLKFLEPSGPENEVLCPKLECLRCVSASSFVLKTLLERRRDAGFPIPKLQVDKETGRLEGVGFMTWIKENTTLEIIEPSEHGTSDTGSEWHTDDDDDELGSFPYFSMEGFSDDDDDDDDDDYEDEYEEGSDMDIESDSSAVEEQ